MSERFSFFLVFSIFNVVFFYGQTQMSQIGSYGFDGINDAVAHDEFIYVTGFFGGRLNGLKSKGDIDAFVAKLDSEGSIHWIDNLGSEFKNKKEVTEFGQSIVRDQDGNIYVTGLFYGELKEDGIISHGGQDIFVVKYSGQGEKLWLKSVGSSGDETIDSFIADEENNIYLVAHLNGDREIAAKGMKNWDDILIYKYDSSGNQMWSIEVERKDENVEIIDIAASTQSIKLLINEKNVGFYVLSYAEDGKKKSRMKLDGINDDFTSLTIDTDENLYLLSINEQTQINLDKKKSLYKIAKVNRKGEKIWETEYSNLFDYSPKEIMIDRGQLNVIGEFRSNGLKVDDILDFRYGTVITNHDLTQGSFINDYFILGRTQNRTAKVILTNETISFVGQFYGQLVFDGEVLSSNGKTDGYILKVPLDRSKDKNADSQEIIVYPNPNQGEFFVNLDFLNGNERLELFDLMGRIVHKGELFPEEEINIRNLSEGVYILHIYNGNEKTRTFKIVKKNQ